MRQVATQNRSYTRAIYVATLVLFFLSLSACSLFAKHSSTASQLTANRAINNRTTKREVPQEQSSFISKQSGADSSPPLKISVEEEKVQGSKLIVKVRVTPEIDIDPRSVVLGLIGLSEGEVIAKNLKFVDQVLPVKILNKHEDFILQFELEALGLSEYQVQCSWGSDAHTALTENSNLEPEKLKLSPLIAESKTLSNGRLEIIRVETQGRESDCEKRPCEINYTLIAHIKNTSENELTGLKLALGIFWVSTGENLKLPVTRAELSPNEELIDIQAAKFTPGQIRKIKVKVDRAIPQVPGGKFLPHLRLLENQ